jgi:arsenate reductase
MSEPRLYGIPNCDQVKKARAWLQARGIEYRFHDFKREGVDPQRLADWFDAHGAAVVVNRRGTTWRALSDAERAQAEEAAGAQALAVAQPSLIKRPVLEVAGRVVIGFEPKTYETLFR